MLRLSYKDRRGIRVPLPSVPDVRRDLQYPLVLSAVRIIQVSTIWVRMYIITVDNLTIICDSVRWGPEVVLYIRQVEQQHHHPQFDLPGLVLILQQTVVRERGEKRVVQGQCRTAFML